MIFTSDQSYAEGQTAYTKKEFAIAAQKFWEAEQGYLTTGETQKAAEMANNRSVALLQAGDPQGALDALQGVDESFLEAKDLLHLAMTLGNRGAALDALNQLDLALEAYQKAADLLKQVGDFERRSYVMQAISKIQFRTGRQLEALATMQAGVEAIPKPKPRHRILRKLFRIPMRYLQVEERDQE